MRACCLEFSQSISIYFGSIFADFKANSYRSVPSRGHIPTTTVSTGWVPAHLAAFVFSRLYIPRPPGQGALRRQSIPVNVSVSASMNLIIHTHHDLRNRCQFYLFMFSITRVHNRGACRDPQRQQFYRTGEKTNSAPSLAAS